MGEKRTETGNKVNIFTFTDIFLNLVEYEKFTLVIANERVPKFLCL